MALMDMCVSTESFFTLRNNFAASIAVMNVSNWILGVGDRHLSNVLIKKKIGSVVGKWQNARNYLKIFIYQPMYIFQALTLVCALVQQLET